MSSARRLCLGIISLILLWTGVPAADAFAGEQEPLNVLFIMSDQHNARALGCYGNRQVQTPSLDGLAADGVRFENAFCQTGQCCPSRYTIWTGRYAHSHGLRWNGVRDPLGEITVGEVFKQQGYATASIGKHHMKHSPVEHGFEVVVDNPQLSAFLRAEGRRPAYQDGDFMPRQISGPVGPTNADNDHHPSGFWANQMIRFLREHRQQPFCAWLSFYGPHTPIVPSRPWAEMVDPETLTLPGNFDYRPKTGLEMLDKGRDKFAPWSEEEHRRVLAYYYGLVAQIDFNIGRVLDELDRLGLADRTVVVYTADHGEMMAEHRTWTKFTLNYDATVRVPLIVRAPGKGPKGAVVKKLVGLVDLMPTLCELAGLETPRKVQGRSLVPLIRGEDVAWRDVIFSEIGYPGRAMGRCVMARSLTHKYVHHDNGRRSYEQLFDLQDDPWETRNRIDDPDYEAVVAALRQSIDAWEDSTDHAPLYPIEPSLKPARRRAR